MSNLTELKAMLGARIDELTVYQLGFDAVKEVEGLDTLKKDIKAELLALAKDEKEAIARTERAIEEAKRIEVEYGDKAKAAAEQIASDLNVAEKTVEKMHVEARDELKALQDKSKGVGATIRDKEVKLTEADARLVVVEGKIATIRGQLKSI